MAKDIYDEWREWQAQRDAQRAADEEAIRGGKYQGAGYDKLRDDLLYEAATPGTSNLTGKVSGYLTPDPTPQTKKPAPVAPYNPPGGDDGGGTQTTVTKAEWDPQLPSFSYDDAPEFVSRYQGLIDEYLNGVLNRPAFSYNYEDDPLYQQYAKSYGDAGRRAMQDTLAQISARTGGIASSYAGSASQQAYNNYMARLADKVPELRELAYKMYQDEDARARSNLSLLQGMDATDYGRFTDRLGQYNTDRAFAYGVYGDERDNALQMAQLAASMGDYRGLKALGIDTSTAEAKARGGSGSGGISKSDARNIIEDHVKMGGSVSDLPAELIAASGYPDAYLGAMGDYYAGLLGGEEGYSGIDTDEALKILKSGDDDAINSPKMKDWYEKYLGVEAPQTSNDGSEITNYTNSDGMMFVHGYGFLNPSQVSEIYDMGGIDAYETDDGKIELRKAGLY